MKKKHHSFEETVQQEMKAATKWMLVFLFFAGSFFVVQQNATQFQASILPTKQHKPFDGTTKPIQKAPNWVKLTNTEWKASYDQIPSEKLVSLPKYDPERIKTPIENLIWGNSSHDAIRNEKITFSTAYMGAYDLKNIEYSGSHLAVDIKVPTGTPVFAIANGIAVKVSLQSTGFGKHVVLKHENVPSLNDQKRKNTLYSSYSHMSEVSIAEGDIVDKGTQIGLVGETGTATTPHLHFQIDNENAPWHPYWPFTFQEASAAGYDFGSAVNAGLGKDKAIANTISPFAYVQKYFSYVSDTLPVPESDVSSETPTTTTTPPVTPETPAPVTPPVTSVETPAPQPATTENSTPPATTTETSSTPVLLAPLSEPIGFTFTHKAVFSRMETPTFIITAVDDKANVLTDFIGQVTLSVSNDLGKPSSGTLSGSDFSKGQATVSLQNLNLGTGKLVATYKGKEFSSQQFEILVEGSSVRRFVLLHDGGFVPGESEIVTIQAVDDLNRPVANFTQSGVVNVALSKGSASLSTASIDVASFAGGEVTIKIKPKSTEDIVVRAWYESINGESAPMQYALFSDVSRDHPHYNAVRYLKKRNIVQGYSDGTFQPDKTVTRVESLKLIYEGLGKEFAVVNTLPFKDTSTSAWYGKYVASAVDDKIVQGYRDKTFRPANVVNRVEFLKMLSLAIGVDINPTLVEKPYSDVSIDIWYAPYVQFAKEKNIFPGMENLFLPNERMTRGDVAEAIYRVMILKDKVADVFAESLVAGADF